MQKWSQLIHGFVEHLYSILIFFKPPLCLFSFQTQALLTTIRTCFRRIGLRREILLAVMTYDFVRDQPLPCPIAG